MVDVNNHVLVPEHRLISDDEAEEVLEEYGVKRTALPKIKTADPALPTEAVPGDVIQIVRDSRTTDTAIAYRLVVE